jgi:hypothetical protein
VTGTRANIARRDSLAVWVWQHMSMYPGTWFSAHQLSRVITERYMPSDVAAGLKGRQHVVESVLREMGDRGEAESRPNPADRRGRVWRYTGERLEWPYEHASSRLPQHVGLLPDVRPEIRRAVGLGPGPFGRPFPAARP